MLTRPAPERPTRSPFAAPGAIELAALVRDAVACGVEREVLLLRLSRLSTSQRRGYHGRLIEDAWQPLRRMTRAQVFDLPNGDAVAVEAPPANHLARIRTAFGDMLDGQQGVTLDGLLQQFRLPQQAAAVMAMVERVLGLATEAPPPPPPGRPVLDAAAVQAAEQVLAMADIEPVLHRGWACRLEPGGGPPEPRWEERRIDMAALCAAVLPDHDPEAVPELSRRLRCAADRRLLAGLTRPEILSGSRHDRCLSLTPDAVLSPEFQRLDALLPSALRGRLTIAMPISDVLADPEGFASLQVGLLSRGHRLALEVDAAADPPLIRVAAAGFGLLCLGWSATLPTLGSPEARALAEALPRDRTRMVLTGVDRPAAIAWGWEMGFRLFSGRLIDRRRQLVQER